MPDALFVPSDRAAAQLAAMDAARARELAVLIEEEEAERMAPPKGTGAPCPECQSTTRHRSGCSKPSRPSRNGAVRVRSLPASARTVAVQPGSSPPDATGAAAPRLLKPAASSSFDPRSLSDDDLAACIAEARARIRSREALKAALEGSDG